MAFRRPVSSMKIDEESEHILGSGILRSGSSLSYREPPTRPKTYESSPLKNASPIKRVSPYQENELPVRTVAQSYDQTGTVIGGYRVLELLGKGGFGETYKAEKNGRYYAFKFIKPQTLYDFRYETNMLQKISSFCSTYFSCLHEILKFDDKYIIVSDYINGPTVDVFFENLSNYEKEHYSFRLLKDLLEAVQLLHENNIVHRDIKEYNIIYNRDTDRFHLIDFGIAVDLSDPTAFSYVKNGAGTHYYRSPDYVDLYLSKGPREDWKSILLNNDYYAVAATLYSLNEDRFPYRFPYSNTKEIYQVIYPVPFREISSRILQEIITGTLLKPEEFNVKEILNLLNF